MTAPGYADKRPVVARSKCALNGGSCNCDPDTVYCPVHNGRAVLGPAEPTDTELLDWLERYDGRVFKLGGTWYSTKGFGHPNHRANSLRGAIFAARQASQKGTDSK